MMRTCSKMTSILIFLLSTIITSNGFLLDDKTPSSTPNGQIMSEKYYNILVNMLVQERNSRIRMEDEIKELKNQVHATQQAATNNYHASHNGNRTLTDHVKTIETTVGELRQNYADLLHKHGLLQKNFTQLKIENEKTIKYGKLLEQELANIKQIQSVADLQVIVNITNQTNNLERELQRTNNQLSLVTNDVNARKQDFIALFNAEQKLETGLTYLENNLTVSNAQTEQYIKKSGADLTYLENNLTVSYTQTEQYINKSGAVLDKKIDDLAKAHAVTSSKLEQEIKSMSNRVAVTVCARTGEYYGKTVLWQIVNTRYGVNNSSLSTMAKTGKFKCEKAGLYMISVFIMSHTDGGYYFLKKNNTVLEEIHISINTHYQTSASVILEHLEINDTVYVIAGSHGSSMYLYGETRSCISILQLSE